MCKKVKYKKWEARKTKKAMWYKNKFVTYYYCKKCGVYHLTHVNPRTASRMAFERLEWLRANNPGYV